jgi:hypothetical protein
MTITYFLKNNPIYSKMNYKSIILIYLAYNLLFIILFNLI